MGNLFFAKNHRSIDNRGKLTKNTVFLIPHVTHEGPP